MRVGSRPAPLCDEISLFGIGIDDANQLHIRQMGQDTGMVLTQVSDADYCNTQAGHVNPNGSRRGRGP
jgi:hypothetical protein